MESVSSIVMAAAASPSSTSSCKYMCVYGYAVFTLGPIKILRIRTYRIQMQILILLLMRQGGIGPMRNTNIYFNTYTFTRVSETNYRSKDKVQKKKKRKKSSKKP